MVKKHSTYRKKSYSKKNTKKNRKVYKMGNRIHNVYANSPHIYENDIYENAVFGTSVAKIPQEWLQKNCDANLKKKDAKTQQLLLEEYELIHKKILHFIQKHEGCYFFNDIKRFNVFNDAIQYFPDNTFTTDKKTIVRKLLYKQNTNHDRFKYNNSNNKFKLLSNNGMKYL